MRNQTARNRHLVLASMVVLFLLVFVLSRMAQETQEKRAAQEKGSKETDVITLCVNDPRVNTLEYQVIGSGAFTSRKGSIALYNQKGVYGQKDGNCGAIQRNLIDGIESPLVFRAETKDDTELLISYEGHNVHYRLVFKGGSTELFRFRTKDMPVVIDLDPRETPTDPAPGS